MATVTLLAATGNYDLGDSGSGVRAAKVIEFAVGSLVGSFAVQGRLAGQGGTFAAIAYTLKSTGATATAALTTTFLIEVPCSGLEVRLAYTHTSGTVGTGTLKYLDVIG